MSDLLISTSRLIAEAAERHGPAVVGLGRGWGHGSGVVIASGRVLATAHSVRRGEPAVVFADGRREPARVAGVDTDLGLAVLDVDTGDVVPVESPPAGAPAPKLGDPVLALANPGGRGLRVTAGFVSAAPRRFRGPTGRRVSGGIEHTAPLPRGSSGGPLLDVEGRLLGVNAVRLDGSLILAVGVDAVVRDRLDALARGEEPQTRRLGVAVAPPRAAKRLRRAVGLPERDGLLVRAVEEDTPAARAGLEPGDLIVAAGGREVDGLDALHAALDAPAGDGAALTLTVVRGVEERDVSIDFAAPAAA